MRVEDKPIMDPYGRFLRLPEVEATVGLKKSKLYALMKEADDAFPSPIHVGTRALWVEADIIAWKAKRIEKARGQAVQSGTSQQAPCDECGFWP